MDLYNGFAPGQKRVVRLAVPDPRDGGHTAIQATTTRLGTRFAFRYAVLCECGVTRTSRSSFEAAHYSHARHARQARGE